MPRLKPCQSGPGMHSETHVSAHTHTHLRIHKHTYTHTHTHTSAHPHTHTRTHTHTHKTQHNATQHNTTPGCHHIGTHKEEKGRVKQTQRRCKWIRLHETARLREPERDQTQDEGRSAMRHWMGLKESLRITRECKHIVCIVGVGTHYQQMCFDCRHPTCIAG
jgi:hypothetical protein